MGCWSLVDAMGGWKLEQEVGCWSLVYAMGGWELQQEIELERESGL